MWGGWHATPFGNPFDHSCNGKMPQGTFIGLTENELLAIKAKAVAMITSGTVMTNYSGSGTSVGKQVVMPAKEMLSEAVYALQLLNPGVYGVRTTVIKTEWGNYSD